MTRARVRIMAVESMHEFANFGPPQLWMCAQNAMINNERPVYGREANQIAKLHRDSITVAMAVLGEDWLALDVRWLALQLLIEGSP